METICSCLNLFPPFHESAITVSCLLFVTLCDRMGDTSIMFKCATTVILCAVHAPRIFPGRESASSIGKASVIWLLLGRHVCNECHQMFLKSEPKLLATPYLVAIQNGCFVIPFPDQMFGMAEMPREVLLSRCRHSTAVGSCLHRRRF